MGDEVMKDRAWTRDCLDRWARLIIGGGWMMFNQGPARKREPSCWEQCNKSG